MIKKISMLVLFLSLLVFSGTAVADVDINPGLWEMTSEIKMQGASMPPSTMTKCLTRDDLVPKAESPNQECEITDMETSGNTVRWIMKCTGEGGESTARGEITYNGDTYEGTMVITQAGTEMTMYMTGRRIGDCD